MLYDDDEIDKIKDEELVRTRDYAVINRRSMVRQQRTVDVALRQAYVDRGRCRGGIQQVGRPQVQGEPESRDTKSTRAWRAPISVKAPSSSSP